MSFGELRKSPEAWFLLASWLLGSLVLLRFVHVFGIDFPQWDEFAHLPVLTRHEPPTWEWLWQPHNEHRIPIAKLLWLLNVSLTNGNYRVPMFLSAVLLILTAAVFAIVVAWHRGEVRFSDASVVFLLLNLAQVENLLWGHQIVFVVGAVVPVLFAAATVRWPRAVHVHGAVAAACWGWGMGPALFLCAAATLLAFRSIRYREETPRWRAQNAVWAGVLFVLFASYLLTYHSVAHHEGARGVVALSGYCTRLLGDALVASASAWPAPSLLVVALLAISAIATWRCGPRRELGGVATLAAFELMLCAVITWGRTPLGLEQAFSSRYCTLMAPLLLAAYALAEGRASSARVSQLAAVAILVVSAGAYAYGAGVGVDAGRARRESVRSAVMIVLGTDARTAAFQTANVLFPDPIELGTLLEQLKHARLSMFSHPETMDRWRGKRPPLQPLGIAPAPDGLTARTVEPDTSLGRPGLLVHAPGRLVFNVLPGTYDLHALFGFRPGAYQEGSTDGADFSVWLESSSRQQLWGRHLNPVAEASDRSPQRLELTVEVIEPARISLETGPGSAGSDAFDWTVWADVGLAPRRP